MTHPLQRRAVQDGAAGDGRAIVHRDSGPDTPSGQPVNAARDGVWRGGITRSASSQSYCQSSQAAYQCESKTSHLLAYPAGSTRPGPHPVPYVAMSRTTVVRDDVPGPNRKWLLPALLVLIILGALAAAFFATHPHVFGGSATSTPTVTPTPHATATPKVGPTGTPRPGPTGTPRSGGVKPGPTGTPRPGGVIPGPTGTPRPGPTGTPHPGGVRPGPTGTPRPGPTGTPVPGPTGTPAAGPTASPTV